MDEGGCQEEDESPESEEDEGKDDGSYDSSYTPEKTDFGMKYQGNLQYDAEEANLYGGIQEDLLESFDKFLNSHEEYSYLRSIDLNKIKVGDSIAMINQCGFVKLEYDFEDKKGNLLVSSDGVITAASRSCIKPLDEYINELRFVDISLLYTEVMKGMSNKHVDCIEYFYVFSEYFRINEKILYNSLPVEEKEQLLDSLNKRTGILKRKNKPSK